MNLDLKLLTTQSIRMKNIQSEFSDIMKFIKMF